MANAITRVLGSRRGDYISRAIDNRKYAATFTIGNWLEGHLKVYNDDK
jgi:hypothetical protein